MPSGSMWAADPGKGIFISQDRAGGAHRAGKDQKGPQSLGLVGRSEMSELILGGEPTVGPQNGEGATPGGSPSAHAGLGTTGHRAQSTAWPQWLRWASWPPISLFPFCPRRNHRRWLGATGSRVYSNCGLLAW